MKNSYNDPLVRNTALQGLLDGTLHIIDGNNPSEASELLRSIERKRGRTNEEIDAEITQILRDQGYQLPDTVIP